MQLEVSHWQVLMSIPWLIFINMHEDSAGKADGIFKSALVPCKGHTDEI